MNHNTNSTDKSGQRVPLNPAGYPVHSVNNAVSASHVPGTQRPAAGDAVNAFSSPSIRLQQQMSSIASRLGATGAPAAGLGGFAVNNFGVQQQQTLQQQLSQVPHQQTQQTQPWGVPNPLGVAVGVAQQQQHQLQRLQQQQQLQQQQRQIQTQQAAAAVVAPKKKVVLSAEAKNALAKAIWSAIRSPTGDIAPEYMEAALKTGLPRHAILNAARVAREREAQKRKQQTSLQQQEQLRQEQYRQQQQQQDQQRKQEHLRQQQQAFQPQKSPPPPPQPISSSQALSQPPMQEKLSEAKLQERLRWKRVQNGIFTVQKGRFLAVPYSVGAVERTKDIKPVLRKVPRRKRPIDIAMVEEVQQLQAELKQRKASGLSTSSTTPVVQLLEPGRYKRIKIEPKKFAKQLDRVSRKARQTAAETLSKQHKELVKALASHHQDFFKFHRQRKADAFRLAKSIRDSFDKEERQKERDAVQAERARLAALKANDMTAYSKLLEETKNERLKYLLEKTEKHFSQISSLLEKRTEEENGILRTTITTTTTKPTSYYATAHKRTEEVRQPTLLVGGDLKEYQLTGLQWLVSLYNNHLNGILADEMGLGKTIQAISLVAYLMEFKGNLGPFLVIVPLSTLSNWQNEFHKWCPAARTVCYKGTPGQRKEIYKDEIQAGHFNVLLTTYEYIIKDKKFLRKIEWQYAIVDEGHRMKNAQSKFAVTLGTQYVTKHRVLLTGTPLMNDLSELWSLLNFLLPSIFNSVETFDQWFSAPFSQFSGTSGQEDESEQLLSNEERILIIHRLHELLRPFMLRRVKSEVLDQLPEKVEKVLRCDLSSWQKELYKQISYKAVQDTSTLGLADESKVPARGLNNIVMQLRKVCNHPYLFSPEGYHINDNIIRSSGKVKLLDDMLPKLKLAGHRILMFTQMTAVMTILEDYFAYRGYLSLRLDGSTPADEREKRMFKFNAPDSPYFIFLLSTRAGGLGLNLTAADTVIIFDSDWNPMMDLQAQDRAHRIGQRSDVSVFRLITNSPVEEKILSRATEKLNVSELVVESGQFNKDSVENDTSLERKRLMEVLLTDFGTSNAPKGGVSGISEKSGSDAEDDDDSSSENSDKEDLNELLSNNEADYQLYAAFDDQKEIDGFVGPALFSAEADVPNWIRNPQPTGSKGTFVVTDDGPRKRKTVLYDDGLTEKQFLRIMEKQAVEEEKSKQREKTYGKGVSPAAPLQSSAEDEEMLAAVNSGSNLTDWTFRKLISCSKSVVALKDPSTKRRLAEIFLEKPDPATFPDYYEIIEKPIAINDILRKCRAKLYANLPEFKDDWNLMFANARKFNGDDSWVVQDATALEKELERVLKKNGFSDGSIPIGKTKKLRIKLSLKDIK